MRSLCFEMNKIDSHVIIYNLINCKSRSDVWMTKRHVMTLKNVRCSSEIFFVVTIWWYLWKTLRLTLISRRQNIQIWPLQFYPRVTTETGSTCPISDMISKTVDVYSNINNEFVLPSVSGKIVRVNFIMNYSNLKKTDGFPDVEFFRVETKRWLDICAFPNIEKYFSFWKSSWSSTSHTYFFMMWFISFFGLLTTQFLFIRKRKSMK